MKCGGDAIYYHSPMRWVVEEDGRKELDASFLKVTVRK
jgi:hypothetical protein